MPVEKIIFHNREEWMEARKDHIGGSDAAACVGLSPYKTNVELWEEKTGRRQAQDISDREYVEYGTMAEAPMRELFRLDYPRYQLTYDGNNMFLNSDYPWMHASLDGELIDQEGRRGILEIKTSNILQGTQWEKWDGRIPDHYYCQILHYLAVTNYEFAVLKTRLKSEWGGKCRVSVRHYLIERDDAEEDINYLVEKEEQFWQCVVSGRRPDLILPVI